MHEDWKEFVDSDTVANGQNTDVPPDTEKEIEPDSDDEWTEMTDEDNQPSDSLDTMLVPQFPVDASLAYGFAPSEGNHPLSLFQDKYSEELAFPSLFCGQCRKDNNSKFTTVKFANGN